MRLSNRTVRPEQLLLCLVAVLPAAAIALALFLGVVLWQSSGLQNRMLGVRVPPGVPLSYNQFLAELVDALDSESSVLGHPGSTPGERTSITSPWLAGA
jgi:hypothetical protein